jgi:formamidopyrimidine-DNA glycosylase
MPELPEVEVLVRHLRPALRGKTIRRVEVRRRKIVAPHSVSELRRRLRGATFTGLSRRGKYLLFDLHERKSAAPLRLVGHLGMTGRMYLLPSKAVLPRHAAVVLGLGLEKFVFEDTRYFGRLSLDAGVLDRLGPEPLSDAFTVESFAQQLKRSGQPIKAKLLDQSLVAGIGNIYASEILFRARVLPTVRSRRLTESQVAAIWRATRIVLTEAIEGGSTVPLDYAGAGERDGLFYFGRAPGAPDYYEERLCVYDRAHQPCPKCRTPISRLVQSARSTFFCPRCQRAR